MYLVVRVRVRVYPVIVLILHPDTIEVHRSACAIHVQNEVEAQGPSYFVGFCSRYSTFILFLSGCGF